MRKPSVMAYAAELIEVMNDVVLEHVSKNGLQDNSIDRGGLDRKIDLLTCNTPPGLWIWLSMRDSETQKL